MVGHDVRTEKLGTGAQRGEERLSLHGVTQEPYFRNVDLTAYAGEVLGVTGLLGDGRSELFSAVFGAETVSADVPLPVPRLPKCNAISVSPESCSVASAEAKNTSPPA